MQTILKKGRQNSCAVRVLFLSLAAVMLLCTGPSELRVLALDLVSGGTVSMLSESSIPEERVIVTGETAADLDFALTGGEKVSVRHGESIDYATTREGESVRTLLRRLTLSIAPLELVLVELGDGEVFVTIDTNITYYETISEAVEHTTVYTPTSRLLKGEVEVTRPGIDGTRDVTYEITYADGALVSRQAVAEENNTSLAELADLGTRVSEAQSGDTVATVVYEADGSGYLVMASGDTLHFTKAVEVKCTAYTAGHDGVGTRTATGTTARRGVVAVDKSVFPLGSKLFVDIKSDAFDYGMAYAEDTGMRGAKLDLYMDSYDECIQFGVRKAVAYLLG